MNKTTTVGSATPPILDTCSGDRPPISFTSIAFSSDGNKLATSARFDGFTSIWDVASGKKLQKFSPHNEVPLTFSPNGEKIATYGNDNTSIWNVASGTKLQTLENSHIGNLVVGECY